MLILALSLFLSQTPPAPSPEALQQFETERGPLLEALSAKYTCTKPRKNPEPLCDVALAETRGAAADIRGQNTWPGLTWLIKPGKGGKVDVGEPRLSALALNKDSVGVWGAVTDITPQNAKESQQLARLTKEYEALLRGRTASVTPPTAFTSLLSAWSRSANHLVEKKEGAWVFKGAPGALRKMGDHWVLMGKPKSGGGLVVSVFVP